MSLALVFPGQGSQQPNMLHALPATPAAESVLDESHSCLEGLGVTGDIDTAVALQETTNVQLALLIAGVASARALTDDCGLTPQFVAGHSIGSFAAAVAVGVLTLDEALTAVQLRGQLMDDACAHGEWGMAALTGLPTRMAVHLVEQVHTNNAPIWIANINSATQTVISGSVAALQTMSAASRTAGAADFEMLSVPVASHCPLQAGTATALKAHLAELPQRPTNARYLTNMRGRAVNKAEAILHDLAQAVAHPVQWFDASRLMPELGATCVVETHPGHVLTRLNSTNAPMVQSLSLQDNGIDDVTTRVRTRHG